jgi:hypothetical protein
MDDNQFVKSPLTLFIINRKIGFGSEASVEVVGYKFVFCEKETKELKMEKLETEKTVEE